LPKANVLALDILPAMVDEARRRTRKAGLESRIRVEVGDMAAPAVPRHSQDLIWCEGAIYFLGIENALRTWQSLLSDNGTVAFTEPIWLQSPRPEEVSSWWQTEYPAITDERGVRDIILRAGFNTIEFFPLPADSWVTDYYEPMQSRISQLLERHPTDRVASEIAKSAEREIDMHRRYSDFYSYGFFIVQPKRENTT
jgi:SAM-dependent methyltransferase